ncbi:hypothetical protein NE604_04480 [Anaerofustis stercorihominis]|jgi:hypothetical protein|nr:hypothetical protein [Anaerofustis stercorihominis]MCQ4794900.1 hypothetical protein [Anaerofustis stercorihominis]DAJ01139.1 MAG TPA: hypothetical protein [Caudoviricetes sp.]
MDYFLAFIGLLWLTFRIGKEDGKWGCFTVLIVIVLIGVIAALID